MSNYEFVTVKLVPNLFRNEPVNVGIMLIDKNEKEIYSKFTNNFDELLKRIGYENLNGFEKLLKFEPSFGVDSTDYLKKLSSGPEDSLQFTTPIPIKVEKMRTSVNKIYNDMISVPMLTDSNIEDIAERKNYIETVKNSIKQLKFPLNTVKDKIEVFGQLNRRKFPFVFYKNERIKHMIDIISLKYATNSALVNQVKIKGWDFNDILRSGKYPGADIVAFSAQKSQDVDLGDRAIKLIINQLKSIKVRLKFADETNEYLQTVYAKVVN